MNFNDDKNGACPKMRVPWTTSVEVCCFPTGLVRHKMNGGLRNLSVGLGLNFTFLGPM